MKNLRLFVFLLLFTSCAQFKGTRGPSSQVNDFIEYTDEGVFHFAQKSKEIALDLAARYPSDKYIIIGWGINSSPVMNELREIHKSIFEVPVTRLNEIYNENYSPPSNYDYPKIEAQTKILYQKIFPSLAEIGNKEIVIFRNLWGGLTLLKFTHMLTRFYKEKGLHSPIHYNLMTDTDEKVEYLKSELLDDSRFGYYDEGRDYRLEFFVDKEYHRTIHSELADRYYDKELTDSQRLANSLEFVKYFKKKGVLHSFLKYEPVSALSIIEDDKFSGFELNENKTPGIISDETKKFREEYDFVNKVSSIEDSFRFVQLSEGNKLPKIIQKSVFMRHLENIFMENPDFDIWDSLLEKITFDLDIKTLSYFLNKMNTKNYDSYIKFSFRIVGEDFDALYDSKDWITTMIKRQFYFKTVTNNEPKTKVINNLINDLRYMYDDQFIIKHWDFFKDLYEIDNNQFYKAFKKSYQSKNKKGFLKHFVFSSSTIHYFGWAQRLSIPELDDYLKKKSCMDYFKI